MVGGAFKHLADMDLVELAWSLIPLFLIPMSACVWGGTAGIIL